MRLAVDGEQVDGPSLQPWLVARRGVLRELSLSLTDVDANKAAVLESAFSRVASACSGGQLSSLSLELHGGREDIVFQELSLDGDILQLAALPHLERLALALHADAPLREIVVDLRNLTALTSLQLSGDAGALDFCGIGLTSSLRHLALPKDAPVWFSGWLVSMRGARLHSMHVDAMPLDNLDSWDPDEDEDEGPEPEGHSLGLAILAQPDFTPGLQALSINLEEGEPFGLPMTLSDAAALARQLRALAVVHFPPRQAPVLARLTVPTRLWLTSSGGRSPHSIQPLGSLPAELSQLAGLRELAVEGAGAIPTLAPLLPLEQLSSLTLPACGLQQPAADSLLALPALQASAAACVAAGTGGNGATWVQPCPRCTFAALAAPIPHLPAPRSTST